MSSNNTVTQEQKDKLEKLRLAYFQAKQTGSAEIEPTREAYQDYAAELAVPLSGKVEPGPDQAPDEGYVKPGGWGANTDPKSWKVTNMKNPPSDFKVVDDMGVNVATNFHTVLAANNYISKHVVNPSDCLPGFHRDSSGSCVPDVTPPTGNVDKFGILMVKKSAVSGKFETDFKLEEKKRNYASGKPSEWSTEYTNESPEVIQNVEATCYERINGFKTNEPDSISWKLNGPPHKDGARFWVIPDYMTDGSSKKTLEIEDPHPNNKGINPKPLTAIGGKLIGQWFGYKGISQQTKDGKRHVESWIHYPVTDINNVAAEQDQWRLYISTDIESKYFKATGKLTTSRLDGTKEGNPPDYKYASVREIMPAD